MELAKERPSNDSLLNYQAEDPDVYDAVTCITRNRPLKDEKEARHVAESLCDILAFMQFATNKDGTLLIGSNTVYNTLRGMEQVTEVARLLSLRIDQYLTLAHKEEV